MKIAIQSISGEHDQFIERWIAICSAQGYDYCLVNVADSQCLDVILDSDVFLFHWTLHNYILFPIMYELSAALSYSKVKVFPDLHSCWHYDDKIAEFFLFKSLNIETVPTYVFADSKLAWQWAKGQNYPLITKLRRGAGSMNVYKLCSTREAKTAIRKAFSSGLLVVNRYYLFLDKWMRFKRTPSWSTLIGLGRGLARLFVPTQAEKTIPKQKSVILFQKFVPGLDHDIRVIVVGNQAIAIKRLTREGDFRASGSGRIVYDPNEIPLETVAMTFENAKKMKMQSCAMDYILMNGVYTAVEVSFDFLCNGYDLCPGYWDSSLKWHSCNIDMAEIIFNYMVKAQCNG